MKTVKFLLPFLGVLFLANLGADEKTAVWERIYRTSNSDEQRYAVMLNILGLQDRSFVPMIMESLSDLNRRNIELGQSNDVRLKVSLAQLLVKELGNLKAAEAGVEVFSVFNEVKDPFLKGEAALTLGKIRAVNYLPFLVRRLESLNTEPNRSEPRPAEIEAWYLVQALELMRNPDGYEPVFLASMGWYSPRSKVRDTAKGALKVMVDDPTEVLTRILTTHPSLKIKLRAVEAMGESNAPAASKANLARQALTQGLGFNPKTREEENDLFNIRKEAVALLKAAGDKSAESVPLLTSIVELDKDENEVIQAYSVLGTNGTEEAVTYLVSKLGLYNERQRNGTNREKENRIVRQLIVSLGEAKSPLGINVLKEMEFSNHTPATVREAKAALRLIPAAP